MTKQETGKINFLIEFSTASFYYLRACQGKGVECFRRISSPVSRVLGLALQSCVTGVPWQDVDRAGLEREPDLPALGKGQIKESLF